MTTVLLLRHGLTAMTGPVLAGRTASLHLDDRGKAQARAAAQRLASVPLGAVVASPLTRCVETARAVTTAQRAAGHSPRTVTDRRLIECDYGRWTGQQITALAKDPMWRVVQSTPSAAVFPDGEALSTVSARAVSAIRTLDATFTESIGEDAVWVACSHGDVIKAILADALGMHLDLFQRIVVDPCSISAIRYSSGRPFVLGVNDTGTDLGRLVPAKPAKGRRKAKASADATVGGGAGAGAV